MNKGEKKKNLDHQALEARRAKSRQRGEPEEESPSDDDGGDGDVDVPWMGWRRRTGQADPTAPALTLLLRLRRVELPRILNLPQHRRRVAGLSPR